MQCLVSIGRLCTSYDLCVGDCCRDDDFDMETALTEVQSTEIEKSPIRPERGVRWVVMHLCQFLVVHVTQCSVAGRQSK